MRSEASWKDVETALFPPDKYGPHTGAPPVAPGLSAQDRLFTRLYHRHVVANVLPSYQKSVIETPNIGKRSRLAGSNRTQLEKMASKYDKFKIFPSIYVSNARDCVGVSISRKHSPKLLYVNIAHLMGQSDPFVPTNWADSPEDDVNSTSTSQEDDDGLDLTSPVLMSPYFKVRLEVPDLFYRRGSKVTASERFFRSSERYYILPFSPSVTEPIIDEIDLASIPEDTDLSMVNSLYIIRDPDGKYYANMLLFFAGEGGLNKNARVFKNRLQLDIFDLSGSTPIHSTVRLNGLGDTATSNDAIRKGIGHREERYIFAEWTDSNSELQFSDGDLPLLARNKLAQWRPLPDDVIDVRIALSTGASGEPLMIVDDPEQLLKKGTFRSFCIESPDPDTAQPIVQTLCHVTTDDASKSAPRLILRLDASWNPKDPLRALSSVLSVVIDGLNPLGTDPKKPYVSVGVYRPRQQLERLPIKSYHEQTLNPAGPLYPSTYLFKKRNGDDGSDADESTVFSLTETIMFAMIPDVASNGMNYKGVPIGFEAGSMYHLTPKGLSYDLETYEVLLSLISTKIEDENKYTGSTAEDESDEAPSTTSSTSSLSTSEDSANTIRTTGSDKSKKRAPPPSSEYIGTGISEWLRNMRGKITRLFSSNRQNNSNNNNNAAQPQEPIAARPRVVTQRERTATLAGTEIARSTNDFISALDGFNILIGPQEYAKVILDDLRDAVAVKGGRKRSQTDPDIGRTVPLSALTSLPFPAKSRPVNSIISKNTIKQASLAVDYLDPDSLRPVDYAQDSNNISRLYQDTKVAYTKSLSLQMFADCVLVPVLLRVGNQLFRWFSRTMDLLFPIRVRDAVSQSQRFIDAKLPFSIHGIDRKVRKGSLDEGSEEDNSPERLLTEYFRYLVLSGQDAALEQNGVYEDESYESTFAKKVRQSAAPLMAAIGNPLAIVPGQERSILSRYFVMSVLVNRMIEISDGLSKRAPVIDIASKGAFDSAVQSVVALLSKDRSAGAKNNDNNPAEVIPRLIRAANLVALRLVPQNQGLSARTNQFYLAMVTEIVNRGHLELEKMKQNLVNVGIAGSGGDGEAKQQPQPQNYYYKPLPGKLYDDQGISDMALQEYIALCIARLAFDIEQTYYYSKPQILTAKSELGLRTKDMASLASAVLSTVCEYRPPQSVYLYTDSCYYEAMRESECWHVLFYPQMPDGNRLFVSKTPRSLTNEHKALLAKLGEVLRDGNTEEAFYFYEDNNISPFLEILNFSILPQRLRKPGTTGYQSRELLAQLFSYADLLAAYKQISSVQIDSKGDAVFEAAEALSRLDQQNAISPALDSEPPEQTVRRVRITLESVPLVSALTTRYSTVKIYQDQEFEQHTKLTKQEQALWMRAYANEINAISVIESAELGITQGLLIALRQALQQLNGSSQQPQQVAAVPTAELESNLYVENADNKMKNPAPVPITASITGERQQQQQQQQQLANETDESVRRIYVPKIQNEMPSAAQMPTSVILKNRVDEINLLIKASMHGKEKPPPPTLIQDKMKSVQFY